MLCSLFIPCLKSKCFLLEYRFLDISVFKTVLTLPLNEKFNQTKKTVKFENFEKGKWYFFIFCKKFLRKNSEGKILKEKKVDKILMIFMHYHGCATKINDHYKN